MGEEWNKIKSLYTGKRIEDALKELNSYDKSVSDFEIGKCSCGNVSINGLIYDISIMPMNYMNFKPEFYEICCSLECVKRVYDLTDKGLEELMHIGEVGRCKFEYKKKGLDDFTTGMW